MLQIQFHEQIVYLGIIESENINVGRSESRCSYGSSRSRCTEGGFRVYIKFYIKILQLKIV